VTRLSAAGCVAADEEADELLATAPDAATLWERVRRREAGEPLAWITGIQRFCGTAVRVERGVYVPRVQSEELARRAARIIAADGGSALDLCTGSGAIARHLMTAVESAPVVATDIDPTAVRCARRNGVTVALADLAAPFAPGTFGVVTAVPPYVPTGAMPYLPADVVSHEPRQALDGGEDGLSVVHRLVRSAGRVLRPGGWLFLELGGDQDRAVAALLEGSGWWDLATWSDEEGALRGLSARTLPASDSAR